MENSSRKGLLLQEQEKRGSTKKMYFSSLRRKRERSLTVNMLYNILKLDFNCANSLRCSQRMKTHGGGGPHLPLTTLVRFVSPVFWTVRRGSAPWCGAGKGRGHRTSYPCFCRAAHPAPKPLRSRWEPPAPAPGPFARLGSLGNRLLLWS